VIAHDPFHGEVAGAAASLGGATTVGNPLYDVLPGHLLAAVLVLLLPAVAWTIAAARPRRLAAYVDGYQGLPPLHRLAVWLLLIDATVHLGLAFGHGGPGLRIAFLAAAAWGLLIVRRLTVGRRWRLQTALLMTGSLVAYWASVAGGEPPDQVGLATKLVEVAALAIVLRPVGRSSWRATAASTTTIVLVVVTSAVAWGGAFAVAGGASGHDHGDGYPAPASRMSAAAHAEATDAQADAARDLQAATAISIERYRDPRVAAADGYEIGEIVGLDHHAGNPAYQRDGRILDPERPESIIYAAGPDGPVLLGAMFTMEGPGEPGPRIGGSITTWHAHEHVCLSLVPPALAGILSPLGGCPIGSIDLPITGEMIHVWTAPGAPQPFGDLDDAWRERYVATAP
jgi:hypothetical protein